MSPPPGLQPPAGSASAAVGVAAEECQIAGGADSSNRPWETDSLRIETGPARPAVLGLLAICAAAALSLADMVLLYSPAGSYASDGFEYLLDVPRWRLLVGHYLGILALPLYIPGYWVVYRGLQPAGRWRSLPVLVLGAYAAAIGGAFHGATAYLALIVQRPGARPGEPDRLLELAQAFVGPLQVLVAGLLLVVSVWFAVVVASGRSRYPRRLAIANPLVLSLVFVAPYLLAPELTLARLAMPAAFNLAHLVFFWLAARQG